MAIRRNIVLVDCMHRDFTAINLQELSNLHYYLCFII